MTHAQVHVGGLLSTVEMLNLNMSRSLLQTVVLVGSNLDGVLNIDDCVTSWFLVVSLSSHSMKYNLQIRFGTTACLQ